MGKKLNIAAIQMDCRPAAVSGRLARATNLIAEAADQGAQLVVMPELFNTGYEFHERNYALAESLDGETVRWLKAQAAQHDLHIVGTLLLRDAGDIYNAAVMAAPDGRLWRYNKHYIPFWERAYFRGGSQVTIADTCLGSIGMMICWDQAHADLWTQYAGQVDVMVVMSCPGDLGTADLVFPDGFRAKFMKLVDPQFTESEDDPEPPPSTQEPETHHAHAAWMGVPLVEASATGLIRTKLPLIKASFPGSVLADRTAQAHETILECGFPPATQVVNRYGDTLARGTNSGDAVVIAAVELAESQPQPQGALPDLNVTPEMYYLSDEAVPAMMVPLYDEGVRRQRGPAVVPD